MEYTARGAVLLRRGRNCLLGLVAIILGLIILLSLVLPSSFWWFALAAGLIASATIALTVFWALEGAQPIMAFQSTGLIDHVILIAELALMVLVTRLCFKHSKYWISILSIAPTLLIAWQ